MPHTLLLQISPFVTTNHINNTSAQWLLLVSSKIRRHAKYSVFHLRCEHLPIKNILFPLCCECMGNQSPFFQFGCLSSIDSHFPHSTHS